MTPGFTSLIIEDFSARKAGKTSPVTKKAPISLPLLVSSRFIWLSIVSPDFCLPFFFFVLGQFMQMPNAAPLEVIATRFFLLFRLVCLSGNGKSVRQLA